MQRSIESVKDLAIGCRRRSVQAVPGKGGDGR